MHDAHICMLGQAALGGGQGDEWVVPMYGATCGWMPKAACLGSLCSVRKVPSP